jgi:hypothetical protein
MDGTGRSRDEIIALLFSAAMSDDIETFADESGVDIAQLRMWKSLYIADYVRYLEAVLVKIKDQIDY